MTALRFALRELPRDVRVHEMRVLAVALIVAVAALTSVGFFTDRVKQAMARQATTMLGADAVVEADDPLPEGWRAKAEALGLRHTGYVTFPSVVVAGERTELVAAKAVAPGYPLRGALRLAEAPYGAGEPTAAIPEPGSVWLDPRLFARLDIATGATLQLGQRRFRVAGALAHEPDRAGSIFELAPRLMLNRADLDATGLIGPASRADYHLLVAGAAEAVERFRRWAAAAAEPGVEVRSLEDARPEMREALDRASSFLGLAAMLAVVLAGAGVAMAVHSLSAREADSSALLRCFGARQRLVVTALLLRLTAVGVAASLAGAGVGWLAQNGLVALLGAWFGDALPPASAWPVASGLAAGLVTLLGFGLVPALRIRRVPVMRVLRREQGAPEPSALAVLGLALAAVAGLIVWQSGDVELAAWVLLGLVGLLSVLAAVGAGLIRLVGRLRGHAVAGWRFGLANLARRPRATAAQLSGFGLGLLALLLLAVVRLDILAAWERDLPAKAPNQFMINIQPTNVDAVRQRLRSLGAETTGFYPIVRGRLVAINDHAVGPEDFESERARSVLQRELNLTYADDHRADNEVVAGQWWQTTEARERRQLSMEQGIAGALGVDVGDRLTFRVAGQDITAPVTSLRRVDWESFKTNFFVIATPPTLSQAPASWITSYWLPPEGSDGIAALARDFPGVTVIDVEAILRQVRTVIDQGTRAVEYVFGFTLLAGIVVLLAAVQASRDERRVEIALLRTLGASRRRVRAILAAELCTLGLLAGAVAAAGAVLTGWAVTAQVMDLPYRLNPWLLVLGPGAGAVGVTLAGLVATRSLVETRPLAVLRGA